MYMQLGKLRDKNKIENEYLNRGGCPVVGQRLSFDLALSESAVDYSKPFNLVKGGGKLIDGRKCDLIVDTNFVESKDLEHALNQAASRLGYVGSVTKNILTSFGKKKFLKYKSGEKQGELEDFIYRVKVPYSNGNKTNFIELDYQMAESYRGYIVRQKDTTDPSVSCLSERGVDNPNELGEVCSFSMAHADTGDIPVARHLVQDKKETRRINESRLDARTKIVGEGARWMLVRNNSHNIADTSKIWFEKKGKGKGNNTVFYVTFRTLWLNWAKVFDSQYNIEDYDVAKALSTSEEWSIQPKEVKKNRWSPSGIDIEVKM
jgi:hypothetical protein